MFRTLLLDDEPISLISIVHSFQWEKFGFYDLHTYTDPKVALEALERENFDIAFIDIRMPELSGFDLISICREKKIPVEFVIVSGFSDFEYAKKALQLGALDYCLKPINPLETTELLPDLQKKLFNKRLKNDSSILQQFLRADWKDKLKRRGFQPNGYLTVILSDMPYYQDTPCTHFVIDSNTILTLVSSNKALSTNDLNRNRKQASFISFTSYCDSFDDYFTKSIEFLLTHVDQYRDTSITEVLVDDIETINPVFYNLLTYVNKNYSKDLSLGILAEKFNLNYSYCSEQFKQFTGLNFSKYLNKLKLNHACDLLENSSASIEEISRIVGYNDYHYFLQVFKKHMSLTPMNYRIQKQQIDHE